MQNCSWWLLRYIASTSCLHMLYVKVRNFCEWKVSQVLRILNWFLKIYLVEFLHELKNSLDEVEKFYIVNKHIHTQKMINFAICKNKSFLVYPRKFISAKCKTFVGFWIRETFWLRKFLILKYFKNVTSCSFKISQCFSFKLLFCLLWY